jgi:hypothetical protein
LFVIFVILPAPNVTGPGKKEKDKPAAAPRRLMKDFTGRSYFTCPECTAMGNEFLYSLKKKLKI